MNRRVLASRIVKAIEADFTDRRGLRQEWDAIDRNTQKEIRAEWAAIVMDLLPPSGGEK